LIFCLLLPLGVLAQSDFSLLGLRSLLQADNLNPAFFQHDGWHVGIGNTSYGLYHSGLSYKEIVAGSDPQILSVGQLQKGLSGSNLFASDFRIESLRIKYGKGKWSIGVAHEIVFHSEISYSDDLINLIAEGNQQFIGETIAIGPSARMYSYNCVAFSFSYSLPKLTIGVSPKILMGTRLANTEKSLAELTTSDDTYQLQLETDFRLDNVGILSFQDGNFLNYQVGPFDSWKPFSTNLGYAVDLGVDFKPSSRFRLSFSVIDLGYIDWKEARSYTSRQSQVYEGARIANVFTAKEISIVGTLDSLRSIFDLVETSEPVSFRLPMQLYGLISYDLTDHFTMNLLMKYMDRSESPFSVGVQATASVTDWLKVGGTVANRFGALNMGLHGILQLQKSQIFVASDQILAGLNPLRSSHLTIRAGVSFHLSGTSFD